MEEIIVVDGKRKHRQISPRNNPELNPCLEEDIQSKQCLERWQNEKDKCELYFENYRLCTRFWNRVRAERKKQGNLI